MTKREDISHVILDFSVVQLELSTFQSCSVMMKDAANQAQSFRSTLANPRGISFGTGNPNLFMATSGHMSQTQLKTYVVEHGPMDSFMCELVLAYLYQYWESIVRPKIKTLIGQAVVSDVFGDLRLIRHALQHEKHRHIAEAHGIINLKVLTWLKQKAEARLTGEAFDAIMYSISLELHRINNTWGNGPSNITAVPTFFSGTRHFGLKDLTSSDAKNFANIGWYKNYVLDTTKSEILALEKFVLGDLHST